MSTFLSALRLTGQHQQNSITETSLDTFSIVAANAAAIIAKSVFSAAAVFAILRTVDKLGDRVGGMLSGLPYTSAAALLWYSAERDSATMVAVVTDAMVTASGYAMFAPFFLAFAHFVRARAALPLAAVSAVALVFLSHLSFVFVEPTVVALLLCGVVLWVARLILPQTDSTAIDARAAYEARTVRYERAKHAMLSPTQRQVVAAVFAGFLVAMLLAIGANAPRWLSSALVGLPVISGVVLSFAHASGSHSKTLRTAEGFIDGCVIRACFCFFFALLLPMAGVASSFALAIAISLALAGSLFWRARMGSRAHAIEGRQALTTVWIKPPGNR
jgi:hypothetical protein